MNRYQGAPSPFAGSVLDRPAAEVAPEPWDPEPTAAWQAGEVPDDLNTDEPPAGRPYAPEPISALPWGTWDDRRPMRPDPVARLAADLTDLPAFREAMARSTRNRAGQCLCGDELAGATWGERVVREGIHMLSVWDLPVVRMLTAMAEADAGAGIGRAA